MYKPLFTDDARVISIGAVCLAIMVIGFLIPILKFFNFPFIKKWYTGLRLTRIMFFIGVIIGFAVSIANNFQIFNESNESYSWIKQVIYLMSSFVSFFVTIMLIIFLFLIPFRLFSNLYMFQTYRNPMKKFLKTTSVYFSFAIITLLISSVQYGFKDSFFLFSSDFSTDPLEFDINKHPTIYYYANYLLSEVFQIKNLNFTIIVGSSIIGIILIEFILIKILFYVNPNLLDKMASVSDKIADKGQLITFINPVFAFTAITTSLMVQPIATILRVILVIILMVMVTIAIFGINSIYLLFQRSISFKDYKKLFTKSFIHSFIKPISDDQLKEFVNNGKNHRAFTTFDKEQDIYNILVTIIFPMVITAYLGFAAGPLFKPIDQFPIINHFIFWISLLLLGYVYVFAYAFKYKKSIPFRIMLSNTVPYVKSGFNTGILSYFNVLIDRFAYFATCITFISVAAKHERQYRKVII